MIWSVLSLGLLIVSMFAAVGRSLESGEWEGFATFGRSGDTFRPCGSRETWWAKNKGFTKTLEKLKSQYSAIAQHPYEQVYVRIGGEISKKGQYGPLGSYQRVLYVEEILEVRAKQETDCAKKK
jgi:hypothetical protein